MDIKFEPRQAARFLRTLQVATGVATSLEDMRRGRGRAAPAATFLALAAKTGDAWRFPEEGLMSGDGLLLAKRALEADGSGALSLQAQGAVGVTAYAGRTARVRAGAQWSGEGVFDRFGALALPFMAGELDDEELASFDLELLDATP